MVFSSTIFLFLFLPVVLAVYFALPWRFRNLFLLIASLFFYAWGETFYVVVMLTSITINYVFGRWIAATAEPRTRFLLVSTGVALNMALLIYFKYANFLVDNLNVALKAVGIPAIDLAPIHLPLGISFFTFQALSYVVDVYRRHVPAARKFTDVALYVALFPQLIAGPIVRYSDVAAEIIKRTVTRPDFASGVRLFIIGLGKKMLLANVLGEATDKIFAIPANELTWQLGWLGPTLALLQLYLDFSAYSDMAIGLGRMFGFHFLPNFRYPLVAQTMTEFWQRWHISLSTWFRDYLFTPLGGYRCSRARAYFNLLSVFFLCGLWHGASWNFIMFGMYQGMYLILERIFKANRRPFFKSRLAHLYLWFVTVTTMVWFRAVDTEQAGAFYIAMFTGGSGMQLLHPIGLYLDNQSWAALFAAMFAITPFTPWLKAKLLGASPSAGRAAAVQILGTLALGILFVLSAMKLAAGTHNPFIYFRF